MSVLKTPPALPSYNVLQYLSDGIGLSDNVFHVRLLPPKLSVLYHVFVLTKNVQVQMRDENKLIVYRSISQDRKIAKRREQGSAVALRGEIQITGTFKRSMEKDLIFSGRAFV